MDDGLWYDETCTELKLKHYYLLTIRKKFGGKRLTVFERQEGFIDDYYLHMKNENKLN